MRYSKLLHGSALLISVLLFFTCKHPLPDPLTPGSGIPGSTGRPCSSDSVYFANDILPLINSSCATAGCHDAITRKDGVQLTSYTTIMKYVVPNNPSNSKLYKEIKKNGNERMPPSPQPELTTEQKAKIEKWISQGAKNNVCDRCDTTDYKYSTAIKPLLQNKCQGCHNSSNVLGGVDLSTYQGTRVAALNGKLYGTVNWLPGYIIMPKSSVKMPECEIKQIKKWIDSGSPNN